MDSSTAASGLLATETSTPLRHSFQSESNVGFQFDSSPIIRHRMTGEPVKMRPVADDPLRPDWVPGAEPGLDPSKEYGGRETTPTPHKECLIRITDFSKDKVTRYKAGNADLEKLLNAPRPDPDTFCRWINVHGLSWDVIQILGKKYHLSRLALEDLLNPKTRTKAEWYKNHLFIVLTLQRLMEIADQDSDKNSIGSAETIVPQTDNPGFRNRIRHAVSGLQQRSPTLPTVEERPGAQSTAYNANLPPMERTKTSHKRQYRTLQEHHGGENVERIDYLEAMSPLRQENLEVMVEQVAIFVTSNNEIISFFETSAEEIEAPIMRRLSSSSTIIRQSADATMVAQSLIDVIIDLSFPITTAFKNAIDQMEIDVLTEKPDKEYANLFYILKSEIQGSKGLMSPVTKMIQTLRNHRKLTMQTHMNDRSEIPSTTITISELTNAYFGDVEDHCIMIEDSMDRMLTSCGEISDLIFNTLNIDTNNTMKTLTFVTAGFLPAQFITGYFGMNFTRFGVLNEDVSYFWKVAVPVTIFGLSVLNWRTIRDRFYRKKQRQIWKKKRNVREGLPKRA